MIIEEETVFGLFFEALKPIKTIFIVLIKCDLNQKTKDSMGLGAYSIGFMRLPYNTLYITKYKYRDNFVDKK